MRVDQRTTELRKLLEEARSELRSPRRDESQEDFLCAIISGRIARLFPNQQSRVSAILRRSWFLTEDNVYAVESGQMALQAYKSMHLEDPDAELTFLRLELLKSITKYILDCVQAIESDPANAQAPLRRETPDVGFIENVDKRRMLTNRWSEARLCDENKLVESSYFMLASFLEGVLHCWIEENSTEDQNRQLGQQFSASKKSKGTQHVTKDQWTLSRFMDYLENQDSFDDEVVKPLKRLSQYRNYIHPSRAMTEKHEISKALLDILFVNVDFVIDWIKRQNSKVPNF